MNIENGVLVVESATTAPGSDRTPTLNGDGQMDWFEEDWLDQYDWDKHFQNLQQSASLIVNQVQALFNKVQSMNNCTISIKIGKFGDCNLVIV